MESTLPSGSYPFAHGYVTALRQTRTCPGQAELPARSAHARDWRDLMKGRQGQKAFVAPQAVSQRRIPARGEALAGRRTAPHATGDQRIGGSPLGTSRLSRLLWQQDRALGIWRYVKWPALRRC